MFKITCVFIALLLPVQAFCWGFYGHRCINFAAVFCLPKTLFAFYKSNIQYITEASTYPDRRRYAVKDEAPRHYIDTEFYLQQVAIDSIPPHFKEALLCYDSADMVGHGILPYHIQRVYRQLVYAFAQRNTHEVLKQSAELGHYVGDLHVPLHTTENYNGQLTNQHGIHGLWETQIPERLIAPTQLTAAPARYYRDVTTLIWVSHKRSFHLKDSVLALEKQLDSTRKYSVVLRHNKPIKSYSDWYVRQYNKRLNAMALAQMKQSVHVLASLWYSAWIDAGQPVLLVSDESKMVRKLELDSLAQKHDHSQR